MPIVVDQMGRRVDIPESPQRIVSLVPSQTELLSYLGLDDQLVGITKFCVHPKPIFQTKTRVGGTKQYHFDKIRLLNPDLIIGNKEENDQAQIEALSKEYPVWMSDITSLEEALVMIGAIGDITKTASKAKQLVDTINIEFDALHNLKPTTGEVRVGYLIWKNPWMAAANNTFIHDILGRAGFTNAFSTHNRYPELSLEELHKADPQAVFLSSEPFPFKEQHLAEIQAVCPQAKVLLVDGELFSWYGNRLLKSASYFRELWKQLLF